ncbi:outer membrane protein assembly factor BamA [Rhodoferax sp. BAB1]|uniref:outer membrane protein assembly factor BamA n=1 Tax=Rhodoferax sp. BAB1 TaxID=2741720 RepID=UPI0015774818|nr:outer membrane protein assembly factor BamA [Rhodoferax sp. BAB1]QKO21419.1 outer membrane protein assembly factor BamA [Rhodoferax sp. BAB1]
MQFKRYGLRAASLLAALLLVVHAAWAAEPFKIRDIQVEGLQRIEPGTIFASMPLRVGDTYNDEKGTASIRSLFALGLFTDVRLEINGDVLVVVVEERPSVAGVEFIGTREFDKDVLAKALRGIGLAEGRPFDKALLDRAEQELKRQYINKSLYAAEVVTTVTPVERNRVNLAFTVSEGEPATISEIRIVGNKAFSESTLRNLFDLDTGNWMSWYTKSNRYSRAKLNADIETLRSYYLTRGYLEFQVESTQVAIAPNKQDMSITLNVIEGERFVVAGVRLAGNYLGREDEFKALVSIQPGEAYNADRVAETVKAFTEHFGRFGYAFARVQSVPDIDRSTNRVALELRAEPSRRAYVRRINVTGNSRTRDEVIRREFRQYESAWYDSDKIQLSRSRVDRLGYFSEVAVETSEVPGIPDQVDLTLKVTERPTGSVTLGAGFSSSEGLGLQFGVSQQNAFGSGNSLGFQVNTSDVNRLILLNTTDPYFTQDGVSRTIDLYQRTSRPYVETASYALETLGASLRFGIPLTERDTIYLGGGIERTTIVPGTYLPVAYQTYADQFGYSSTAFPLTLGWGRDGRDSALVPTSGTLQRASAEWSTAGEVRYLRATYQYQHYVPLTKQYTFAFNTDLGLGKAIGGRPYPLFKNFYGGGLGSVRGFEAGSLGPRDATTNLSYGGPKKINFNFELQAPFPGAGNDRTLRLYTFIDTGNVYGADESIDPSDFRVGGGIGLSWVSPMGPLRLAVARPLRKFDGDRIQFLQFQIGTTF